MKEEAKKGQALVRKRRQQTMGNEKAQPMSQVGRTAEGGRTDGWAQAGRGICASQARHKLDEEARGRKTFTRHLAVLGAFRFLCGGMKFLARMAGEAIEDVKTKLKIEKMIGE